MLFSTAFLYKLILFNFRNDRYSLNFSHQYYPGLNTTVLSRTVLRRHLNYHILLRSATGISESVVDS